MQTNTAELVHFRYIFIKLKTQGLQKVSEARLGKQIQKMNRQKSKIQKAGKLQKYKFKRHTTKTHQGKHKTKGHKV